MYEIVAATAPDFADQQPVGRKDTLEEAERLACCHRRQHPQQDWFIFRWVTDKTRLIVAHSLNL